VQFNVFVEVSVDRFVMACVLDNNKILIIYAFDLVGVGCKFNEMV
jgi:hypothetical protein